MKNVQKMNLEELQDYDMELMLEMTYSTREMLKLQERIKELSDAQELVDTEIERREIGSTHAANQ